VHFYRALWSLSPAIGTFWKGQERTAVDNVGRILFLPLFLPAPPRWPDNLD